VRLVGLVGDQFKSCSARLYHKADIWGVLGAQTNVEIFVRARVMPAASRLYARCVDLSRTRSSRLRLSVTVHGVIWRIRGDTQHLDEAGEGEQRAKLGVGPMECEMPTAPTHRELQPGQNIQRAESRTLDSGDITDHDAPIAMVEHSLNALASVRVPGDVRPDPEHLYRVGLMGRHGHRSTPV
jgi:hypothetical protein